MVWLERHFQQALGQVITVLQNIVLFFLSCLPFVFLRGAVPKRIDFILRGTAPKRTVFILRGTVPKRIVFTLRGTVPKRIDFTLRGTVPKADRPYWYLPPRQV